jgi:hypothetical protein
METRKHYPILRESQVLFGTGFLSCCMKARRKQHFIFDLFKIPWLSGYYRDLYYLFYWGLWSPVVGKSINQLVKDVGDKYDWTKERLRSTTLALDLHTMIKESNGIWTWLKTRTFTYIYLYTYIHTIIYYIDVVFVAISVCCCCD